jgi:hypothetical protein
MGEWSGKQMLDSTDEEVLNELRKNEPGHHQSISLQMAVAIRNTKRLAEAIVLASKAGNFLAWVVAIATAVTACVEVAKLYLGK